MSKILTIFVTAVISLSFLGCGGATAQPKKNISQSKMPSWYLSEVPTDSISFYGVGEGSSKELAKSKALAQISGTISTTVESAMEMTETDTTENGYSQESKSNIKSSTDSIKFTGITVIDTAYVDGKFYTYLKVDREQLFNSLKGDLDSKYSKISVLFKQMKANGIFDILKNSAKVDKMVSYILSKPTIEILKSIKPSFKATKYRAMVVSIQTDLAKLKSKAVIYIKSKDSLSSHYKDILKKYISSYGITLVNNKKRVKDKTNLLVVDVAVKAKKKNVKTSDPRLRGASFAAVHIYLTTKNHKGKIVAQNIVNVVNISKDGLSAAKIKTRKFERELKRRGVLNILLKNQK